MASVAHALIAEAAKSRKVESWISRQILAGRKPSQILAELRRGPVAIGGDGAAGLTFASVVMFAMPFVLLGWVLPT